MGSQPCHRSDSSPCLNSKIFYNPELDMTFPVFLPFGCSSEDQTQDLLQTREVFYH